MIARCQRGYWSGKTGKDWVNNLPRTGTLAFRATRWRLKHGIPAWSKKSDSVEKTKYLLSLMPDSCIAADSTRYCRDLTIPEQEKAQTARNQRPNKATKAVRARRAALAALNQDVHDMEDAMEARLFAPNSSRKRGRKRHRRAQSVDEAYRPAGQRKAKEQRALI